MPTKTQNLRKLQERDEETARTLFNLIDEIYAAEESAGVAATQTLKPLRKAAWAAAHHSQCAASFTLHDIVEQQDGPSGRLIFRLGYLTQLHEKLVRLTKLPQRPRWSSTVPPSNKMIL